MNIVRMLQGSPEWHEHRRKYRNASETAVVLKLSPWLTPYQLWQQKLGLIEQEVTAAKLAGADFVVFGPVFGKSGTQGVGLPELHAACAHGIPVFALGGVNLENFRSCFEAGAAGIAGIRLFQDGDVSATLTELRKISPSR